MLAGKTTLSRAERLVVGACLVSSLTSAASAFFATEVSDTVPLSELERNSSPMTAD